MKVHGVDGLHVIDAPTVPTLPVVPTNMTPIMISERCAELLPESLRAQAQREQPELVA